MSSVYKCRRCGKKRKSLPGRAVSTFVGSSVYGQGEVLLPNPICKKCFNEFGNWWYQHIHNGVRA